MSRRGDSSFSNGTGTKENIHAIEQDIARHQRDIDGLFVKVNSVGRANWQIILSGVGVTAALMASLWTLTVSPINKEVERLDKGLTAIYGVAGARGVAIAEISVKVGHLNERIEFLRNRLQRTADNNVSAKEFVAAQSASLAHRAELQKQLDALAKKIDDVFPPSKTLEDLTRRLAELERTRGLPLKSDIDIRR